MSALRNLEPCFYVYALIDPTNNELFYIGKGKGDRWKRHGKEGLRNSRKWRRIKQIKASGNEYRVIFLATGLTSSKALIIERQYIQQIGIKKLTNIRPGENDVLIRTKIQSFALLQHMLKQPKGYWRDKLAKDFVDCIIMVQEQIKGQNVGSQEPAS